MCMSCFNPINKYITCAPTCRWLRCEKARPSMSVFRWINIHVTGTDRDFDIGISQKIVQHFDLILTSLPSRWCIFVIWISSPKMMQQNIYFTRITHDFAHLRYSTQSVLNMKKCTFFNLFLHLFTLHLVLTPVYTSPWSISDLSRAHFKNEISQFV